MNLDGRPLRQLPWTDESGRPCYLSADGIGTGPVSRLADRVEAVQLAWAERLHEEALDLFAEGGPEELEVDCLAARLTDALRDVLVIAESRGLRLGLPGCEGGIGGGLG
ncbi:MULTISPECIES: hypothetical protein [unclassified Streptomyces]|uniref:hypothetical protein n=1 Tax=unclassified Streptomyces TaxID=2593676 RepID=UPI003823E12D